MSNIAHRESWGSRIGLILAVAGNAIGLGNFLRFPVQAAENGGGTFMIPYFISFFLLGIPLMWMEWSIGRFGGRHGYGSTPGMFSKLWNHPAAKYLGILGLFIPFTVMVYYCFIESWTLGYSFFAFMGTLKEYIAGTVSAGGSELNHSSQFLKEYQGVVQSDFFSGFTYAVIFLVITLGANFWVLYKGLSGGIEKFAKIAMPLLFLFAILLVIRIFTLDTPAGSNGTISQGLAYIWNPNFSELGNVNVWLAAAGQIFFTLSLGMGSIHVYASYLKDKDDVALNGLSTGFTNEFAEVILGSAIAIPVAVLFFGLAETVDIAKGGSFNLGFVSMSVIFNHIEFGSFFGFIWFFLLFFAGITSSIAMGQPIVAFMREEFKWSHEKAVIFLFGLLAVLVIPVVLYTKFGYLDELDFWAGTFFLVVFGAIECILFVWVFGMDNAWKEINLGADIKIPKIFYYIMKYITPVFLIVLLGAWVYQSAWDQLMMKSVSEENLPYVLGARIFMIGLITLFAFMVAKSWKNKKGVQ